MPIPDFSKIREDFPMLKQTMHGRPLVYLDSAATAQKPQKVIDAITHFYQNAYGTVHRAVYQLSVHSSEEYERTRLKVVNLLNAACRDEIIFTRGTTESINMVAYSFGKIFIQPGDEIIISEIEHHSNIVPWQILCEDRGAILKVIPVNDRAEVIIDEYAKLLSNKTKLVAICHVANSTGTLNPVKEMVSMAHHVGAKVLVDGAQSTPHMPVDVQDLDADFYVFSGHKFYGPTGIGILYGKKHLLEAMPPYQGGGDMIDIVTFDKTTYNVLPLKFEAGTPMIAEVIALGAAIDYIDNIGLPEIFKWENELNEYAHTRLEELNKQFGALVIGTAKQKGAILSFVIPGVHHLDIGALLDLRGIAVRTGHHCAQPTMSHFNVTGTVRASFAFYNTKGDIDALIKAIQEIVPLIK